MFALLHRQPLAICQKHKHNYRYVLQPMTANETDHLTWVQHRTQPGCPACRQPTREEGILGFKLLRNSTSSRLEYGSTAQQYLPCDKGMNLTLLKFHDTRI